MTKEEKEAKKLATKKRNTIYKNEFAKKTYYRKLLQFNKEKEKDIIDFLNSKENVNIYIKQLIIDDMNQQKQNN